MPQVNRPSCIADIEAGLAAIAGVKPARVNLTGRRVAVVYAEGEVEPQALIDRLGELGYWRGPSTRAKPGCIKDDREAQGPAPGAGGGGLRRRQRDAALGLRLVGGGGRDARSLPLALGA